MIDNVMTAYATINSKNLKTILVYKSDNELYFLTYQFEIQILILSMKKIT